MHKRAVRPERFVWSMLAMAITAPVWAHHSAAGYDLSKTLSAQATLKEFRWSAPHSAAVFTIKGPDGKPNKAIIELVELVSVITTAETLGKQVMLTAGKNAEGIVCVSVILVDKYPNTPTSFWSI